MKKSYLVSVLGLLVFCTHLFGQNPQKCATVVPLNQAYEDVFQEKIKQFLSQANIQMDVNGKSILPTKDIPIIFHIVHDGTPATNIATARVLEQLAILNDDFAGAGFSLSNTPIYWSNSISNTGIKFCLTTKDKNGNQIPTPSTIATPTTTVLSYGIDRININPTAGPRPCPGLPVGNIPAGGYSIGDIDAFIKPIVNWDANNYLNMIVVPISGGVLGYAVFPNIAGNPTFSGNTVNNLDGVVCTSTSVGNSGSSGGVYNKGRTMTHEVGHWLGLRHTFGDGTNCGDDFCADTPPTLAPTFGCPAFPSLNSCSPALPGAQTANFMDYTDDSCMYLFTNDQALRMYTALQFATFRQNLGNANYCSWTPTGSPLQATAFPKAGCPNFTTQLNGWAPYAADSVWWETPGATPVRTSGASANVIYASAITQTAIFKAKYPGIPAPKTKSVTITVNAANCATQTPFAFFSFGVKDTCLGTKITFKNNSASSSNFKWTFQGGTPPTSTVKNPQVVFNTLGKHEVILEAFTGPNQTGLTNIYKDTVEVRNCKAIAKIDSAVQLSAKTFCNYETITFKNASIASDSIYWRFPDGYPDNSTLESPTVSYAKPGQYKVLLYAKNPIGFDTTSIIINIVKCASACGSEDTIANLRNITKTSILKNTNGWGFVAGHNSDKDLALAEKYTDYPTNVKEIRGAIIYFARKYDGNQPSDYKVKIRDADIYGYPDLAVAQTNISMLEISTGPGYKGIEVVFNPKAYVSNESFFVTFENLNYPALNAPFGSQDSIAIYSTADNPNTTGTAFKRWSSDNQWHAMSEAVADNKNISLAMYPIVCGPVGLDEIYNKTNNVVIYPNPASDILYLGFNSNKILKYAYKIFDNTGKIIKQENEFRTKGTVPVDISNLNAGFYHIQINNNGIPEYYRFTKQ
jgi:Pregnancy-associated plasma protein-A/Secretion system C-terminal sorting domain